MFLSPPTESTYKTSLDYAFSSSILPALVTSSNDSFLLCPHSAYLYNQLFCLVWIWGQSNPSDWFFWPTLTSCIDSTILWREANCTVNLTMCEAWGHKLYLVLTPSFWQRIWNKACSVSERETVNVSIPTQTPFWKHCSLDHDFGFKGVH
jgi:hypothetical protein